MKLFIQDTTSMVHAESIGRLAPDGDPRSNPVTQCIAALMYLAGIPAINADSAWDLWRRISLLQLIAGPLISPSIYVTRKDVSAHMGLKAHAEETSFSAFCDTLYWYKRQPEDDVFCDANGGKSALERRGVNRLTPRHHRRLPTPLADTRSGLSTSVEN